MSDWINIATLALPHGLPIEILRYGPGHMHQISSGAQLVTDFDRDDLHCEVTHTQGTLAHRTGYDALGRKLVGITGMANDASGPARGRAIAQLSLPPERRASRTE
jgi:hypothetical protein